MTRHRSLLRPLGIVGYDAIEPALLAALATAEPLLLVSDHGAAKTLLLVRLAGALGLEFRHYNASLLQFDDLLGFPIPDERGGVRYAAPPGAIWGAQAAFFDEIGRCRPESANKLFPLIHERRMQGVALESLRYRWAATNPPAEALDADRLDDPYEGVEPLDPALADRFSFVIALPRFSDLSDADRMAVVGGAGECVDPDAARQVAELVQATRELIAARSEETHQAVVAYVMALLPGLQKAGIATGGRRAATLCRNVEAVLAASAALGRSEHEAKFTAALMASIPDVVRRHIPRSVIVAAHRAAWHEVTVPKQDPRRLVLAVQDPLRRALLAITLPRLRLTWRGEVLCEALAELPKSRAAILAWLLLPRLVAERVVAAHAVETVANLVDGVARGGARVRGWGSAQAWVREVRTSIADTGLADHDAQFLFNLFVEFYTPSVSMSGSTAQLSWRSDLEDCLECWRACRAALGELPPGDATAVGEAA